jgi:hypothetical protein
VSTGTTYYVVDIDDDMKVLLQGKDGLCLPGRYAVPASVVGKDVREALRGGRDVEAVLTECQALSGGSNSVRTVDVIRVFV